MPEFPENFSDEDLELEEPQGFPIIWVVPFAVVLLIFLLKRKRREKSELDEIVEIIKKEGGRITQKELRKRLPYSEAKVSLMLSELEDKKIIKKYEDLSDTKADVFNFKIHVDFKFDLSKENIIQKLKLEKKHAENFTTIDENNSIEIFEDEHELIQAYIKIKLEYEGKRKAHLIQKNIKDIHINASRYIFIKAVTDGDIIVNKKKKTEIISQIEKIDRIIKEEDSYDYLLRMPIYSLTLEKMEDLKSKIIQLKTIVKELESKTNSDMWLEDLV